MTTVDLPLLPLGRGVDLGSERGVECPGDLPPASDPDLVARARAAKEALGDKVFVLGHHYQDEPDRLPHFVWAMESLVAGQVVDRIEVDPETEKWALVALERMLALPGRR